MAALSTQREAVAERGVLLRESRVGGFGVLPDAGSQAPDREGSRLFAPRCRVVDLGMHVDRPFAGGAV